MTELLSFLIVIGAGLFLSELFKSFHLPYVIGLIIAGVLIGPHGFGIFSSTPVIEFLGDVGLVFLMFMAGSEARMFGLKTTSEKPMIIAFFNALIPFIVGLSVMLLLGYSLLVSLFVATIFISSSIAILVPSLETLGLHTKPIGKTIIRATIIEDVFSLIVFAVLLHGINPSEELPFLVLLPLYVFIIYLFASVVRGARKYFLEEGISPFELELRFTILVLLTSVFLFELMGLHAVIAGFFAGMILSDTRKEEKLNGRIHAISYGIFIPVFFILIGTKIDFSALNGGSYVIMLACLIILASLLSKILSGFLGGRIAGFSSRQSWLIGASSTPQLSTTLAVAYTGFELGVLDQKITVAITLLSIMTTFAGPFLIRHFNKKAQLKTKAKTRTLP